MTIHRNVLELQLGCYTKERGSRQRKGQILSITSCLYNTAEGVLLDRKHRSRHAAHAAKALRWRVNQLLKCLIKKITLSPRNGVYYYYYYYY